MPTGANLGLGCGNPQAIAALQPGETVLDLGSGAGFDAFLAARAVGTMGRVIGVDMTPEMVSKARKNQAAGGYANIEFRLGEIESLPVADASVGGRRGVVSRGPARRGESLRPLRGGARSELDDGRMGS